MSVAFVSRQLVAYLLLGGKGIPVGAFKMRAERFGLLVIAAAVTLSCASSGHAQDGSYREFAEGRYAATPVRYPADVPLDTVRELVAIVAKQTNARILFIQSDPEIDGEAKRDRLEVFTCSEDESCNGGRFFRFDWRDGRWISPDPRPGFWVE